MLFCRVDCCARVSGRMRTCRYTRKSSTAEAMHFWPFSSVNILHFFLPCGVFRFASPGQTFHNFLYAQNTRKQLDSSRPCRYLERGHNPAQPLGYNAASKNNPNEGILQDPQNRPELCSKRTRVMTEPNAAAMLVFCSKKSRLSLPPRSCSPTIR